MHEYIQQRQFDIYVLCHASLMNQLSFMCLQFCLLLLFSSYVKVFVTVMEKQSSDLREQELHAVTQSCSESVIAYDSSLERGQSHSSEISLNQEVSVGDGDFGLDLALFIELLLATCHYLFYNLHILLEASHLYLFLQQFYEPLLDEHLQQCLISVGIFLLLLELLLGVLHDSFYHIEPNLHFGHSALVDLPTLEYLLGHFDIPLHSFEDILILVVGLVLDLVQLELLLSICLIIDGLQLLVLEPSDCELEPLHPCLEDLMGVRNVLVHYGFNKINIRIENLLTLIEGRCDIWV